jgi:hypothetical protein
MKFILLEGSDNGQCFKKVTCSEFVHVEMNVFLLHNPCALIVNLISPGNLIAPMDSPNL